MKELYDLELDTSTINKYDAVFLTTDMINSSMVKSSFVGTPHNFYKYITLYFNKSGDIFQISFKNDLTPNWFNIIIESEDYLQFKRKISEKTISNIKKYLKLKDLL